MAFCSKCGAQLEDGAKFCASCGAASGASEQKNQSGNTDFSETIASINKTADTTSEFDKADIDGNKLMGVLAYLGILVLIPLFAAKNSKFARFHVNQGLVLIIFDIIVGFACGILKSIPFIWWIGAIITPICSLAILALIIIGIVNVVNGKAKELPIIGKYVLIK